MAMSSTLCTGKVNLNKVSFEFVNYNNDILFCMCVYEDKNAYAVCSCHPIDIAYVYHSIKLDQTASQHNYGEYLSSSPQLICQKELITQTSHNTQH